MESALFYRDGFRESSVDYPGHYYDTSRVQQQPCICGIATSPVVCKSPLHLRETIPLGMSTLPPSHSVPELDSYMLHTMSCFPLDIDAACHQQVQDYWQPQHGLPHCPPFQCEVPEIQECSSWMRSVLDDFSKISPPELSPLGSTTNGSDDRIPPPQEFSCPGSLPIWQPHHAQRLKDESPPPPQPITPPTIARCSPVLSSPSSVNAQSDVSLLLPTPKPLKPGRSRRYQRVAEKSNVEVVDHVRRERQRRDDMSLKISTLEWLLPPVPSNCKRDRVAIVHDSIHYVKSLQKKVEELKEKMAGLQLKKRTRSAPWSDGVLKVGTAELPASSSKSQFVEYHVQVEGEGEAVARLEKCRCRSDFMSSAMKVLEQLNLDVKCCTITKMCDCTICVIAAKPRLTSKQVATSACVVSAFRSCLQLL